MLYDPKWEKTVKADPLTLPALIAWLERQPADGVYCYTSIGHCLIAQYLNASGIRTDNVNPRGFYNSGTFVHFPPYFDSIANDSDNTFGAALARARARAISSPDHAKE